LVKFQIDLILQMVLISIEAECLGNLRTEVGCRVSVSFEFTITPISFIFRNQGLNNP
jgi:hypothetical protein